MSAIIDKIRLFNAYKDDFLIELSIPLLMIGFVAGTVDVLTRGGLSAWQPFSVSWSIIQAIAIDGLFFAVWSRVARSRWSKATAMQNCILLFVGLLLAMVAILINGLLSYQELNNLSSIQQAMRSLAIDEKTFTYARSCLVVFVSILVALFCRVQQAEQATPVAIPPATRVDRSYTSVAIQPVAGLSPVSLRSMRGLRPVYAWSTVAIDDRPESATTSVAVDQPSDYVAPAVDQSSHRDRIKQIMVDDPSLTYAQIASAAGASLATVKKYAPAIKKYLL